MIDTEEKRRRAEDGGEERRGEKDEGEDLRVLTSSPSPSCSLCYLESPNQRQKHASLPLSPLCQSLATSHPVISVTSESWMIFPTHLQPLNLVWQRRLKPLQPHNTPFHRLTASCAFCQQVTCSCTRSAIGSQGRRRSGLHRLTASSAIFQQVTCSSTRTASTAGQSGLGSRGGEGGRPGTVPPHLPLSSSHIGNRDSTSFSSTAAWLRGYLTACGDI